MAILLAFGVLALMGMPGLPIPGGVQRQVQLQGTFVDPDGQGVWPAQIKATELDYTDGNPVGKTVKVPVVATAQTSLLGGFILSIPVTPELVRMSAAHGGALNLLILASSSEVNGILAVPVVGVVSLSSPGSLSSRSELTSIRIVGQRPR